MIAMLFLTLLIGLCPTSYSWVPPSARNLNLLTALRATTATSNNVVLRPSQDAEAFDSFEIGSARVHRYIREGTSDGSAEAEYVMWFDGRSQNLHEDKSLPALSTGRIGSATSRNGLQWEKVTEGSLAEDSSDVSLGLNQESWWGFDTSHVGLGQVMLPMSTPAVVTEGGVYIMYFFGGSQEETPLSDYIETDSDAKVKGMKMRIGVAISNDGKTWGRVEGDDPTGACVAPYDKEDPNQKGVSSMRDDDDSLLNLEEELYCAWPEVAVKMLTEDEQETKLGKKMPSFFMYYSTMRKSDKKKCLALAVSTDGFEWMKRGICLEPDDAGMDAAGCARCNVLQKASFEDGAWKNEDGWVMLYEGVSKEDGKHRIMMAESEDGRSWEKRGIAFNAGESEEAWDFGGVGSPHVIRLDDGSMRMYYTGKGADGSSAIGVAKVESATDMTQWTREQAEFAFN